MLSLDLLTPTGKVIAEVPVQDRLQARAEQYRDKKAAIQQRRDQVRAHRNGEGLWGEAHPAHGHTGMSRDCRGKHIPRTSAYSSGGRPFP